MPSSSRFPTPRVLNRSSLWTKAANAPCSAAVMGAFYASTLGLGAYLAGMLGRFAERLGEGQYFLVFGCVTAGAAVVALLIGAPLRRLAVASGAALRVRSSA